MQRSCLIPKFYHFPPWPSVTYFSQVHFSLICLCISASLGNSQRGFRPHASLQPSLSSRGKLLDRQSPTVRLETSQQSGIFWTSRCKEAVIRKEWFSCNLAEIRVVGIIRMKTEEDPGQDVFCNPEWNQTYHLYIEEVGDKLMYQTYIKYSII